MSLSKSKSTGTAVARELAVLLKSVEAPSHDGFLVHTAKKELDLGVS